MCQCAQSVFASVYVRCSYTQVDEEELFVDESAQLVYFMGTKDTPLESHLYVASFANATGVVHRYTRPTQKNQRTRLRQNRHTLRLLCLRENSPRSLCRLTAPGLTHSTAVVAVSGGALFVSKATKCVICVELRM